MELVYVSHQSIATGYVNFIVLMKAGCTYKASLLSMAWLHQTSHQISKEHTLLLLKLFKMCLILNKLSVDFLKCGCVVF